VHHSRLAGQEALTALAWEEAAGHFRHALDVQRRAAQATPASRAALLLSLAEALTKTGPDPAAARSSTKPSGSPGTRTSRRCWPLRRC
jgi:hypothetical protein